MEASPTRVIQYFNGEKQNLIPLFQRPYTWNKDNWQALWDDLMVQYEGDDTGTHFMGAIVSVPARTVPVGVSKYLIIDGQQRLTTVSLLLCALRDCLDTNSAARIHEVYLTNRFLSPEDTPKLVPTQADREIYHSIAIDRQEPQRNKDIRMAAAYHFFKDKLIKGTDPNDEPVDSSKVLTALEQCLQVVMINLGDDDDPYLIFESLNFKGEPLTQADLVRNYLLMHFHHSVSAGGEQERIYSKYWVPLENKLKSDLTEFLRHYIMKDGNNIKQGGIYAAIKDKLKKMNSAEIEVEAESMQKFGVLYSRFLSPDQEEETTIRDCLENIKELKVTTSYPLLLRLFHARQAGNLNNLDLETCLVLIESFVVRRAVCGVPTNQLNKLFILWAKNFPDDDHVQWLHKTMSSGGAGRRFPKDEEFSQAFLSQPQYKRGATRFILCRLEKSFNHKETVDLTTTTVEHILPQTLNDEWRKDLGSDADKIHSQLGNTLGNLTLTSYNSELSNLPFSIKKATLANTHIELNRWILQQNHWTELEITQRAESLLERAIQIWLAPLTLDNT
jgi:uncharacterized protein with ParB-like and HNH nuclease domain